MNAEKLTDFLCRRKRDCCSWLNHTRSGKKALIYQRPGNTQRIPRLFQYRLEILSFHLGVTVRGGYDGGLGEEDDEEWV